MGILFFFSNYQPAYVYLPQSFSLRCPRCLDISDHVIKGRCLLLATIKSYGSISFIKSSFFYLLLTTFAHCFQSQQSDQCLHTPASPNHTSPQYLGSRIYLNVSFTTSPEPRIPTCLPQNAFPYKTSPAVSAQSDSRA